MARQAFEYHPTIGYRFIPGLKARLPHGSEGYLVRANNLGFRCDHDVTPARPAGMRRVLLFGDSFTAGDGVSNGQRYGDLLEQKIERLEVLNFGLPGSGTDQHYLAYREYARDVDHDVLVIAVLVENLRRVVARARVFLDDKGVQQVYAKPFYALEGDRLILHNVPVPKQPIPADELDDEQRKQVDRGGRFETLRGLVNQLGLRDLAQKVSRYQPLPEYDRADDPDWLLMRRLLEQWIGEHERPVLLVPIPLYQYVEGTADPSPYRARFAELAAAAGCALHDPLDDMRAYPAAERRGFRFDQDPHLTRAGHAALAASLAPPLEAVLDRSSEETTHR